ncbi:MAG: sigma-70 family RNA polymerase sigma factor [Acidobacteria bacterium]|nr:sigma-70 family RNA polymerase sigma factor [Acidobacteriota bacterium]
MEITESEVERNAAFSSYVLPEIPVLSRVALSMTRNNSDAEDLVQDTMLRAYRSIDRFDGRYPRAWLMTIMRNAQINRVRRRRPELLRDPDRTMDEYANQANETSSVEDEVVDPVFDSVVAEAFNRLPPKYRTVLELVDLGELSYREAADVLDVPVGTIMSRLHRARKRIRNELEDSPDWSRNGATP